MSSIPVGQPNAGAPSRSDAVARPLVQQLVRRLMEETHAGDDVLRKLGGEIAACVDGETIDVYTHAWGQMGLGTLRLVRQDGQRFTFDGQGLLARPGHARATTCYLALGFLCGAVARLEGHAANGTELHCASRGESACQFIVRARG